MLRIEDKFIGHEKLASDFQDLIRQFGTLGCQLNELAPRMVFLFPQKTDFFYHQGSIDDLIRGAFPEEDQLKLATIFTRAIKGMEDGDAALKLDQRNLRKKVDYYRGILFEAMYPTDEYIATAVMLGYKEAPRKRTRAPAAVEDVSVVVIPPVVVSADDMSAVLPVVVTPPVAVSADDDDNFWNSVSDTHALYFPSESPSVLDFIDSIKKLNANYEICTAAFCRQTHFYEVHKTINQLYCVVCLMGVCIRFVCCVDSAYSVVI